MSSGDGEREKSRAHTEEGSHQRGKEKGVKMEKME
jgi:hypothetical protein